MDCTVPDIEIYRVSSSTDVEGAADLDRIPGMRRSMNSGPVRLATSDSSRAGSQKSAEDLQLAW